MSGKGEIILYQDKEGEMQIEVHMENETVWLSQAQMAELFHTNQSGIARHLQNIFKSGELEEKDNMQKMHIVGSNKPVSFYNLDVIISVGYRVNSKRGVKFRIWATKVLKEYLIKGFVIDDERLSGEKAGYFDELMERVRKIRTSEVNFYEKVKAVFTTSVDYEKGANEAKTFFSTVQNKFHFAITGLTAAEIIVNRVDSTKRDMGLMHHKKDIVTRDEAEVAKNYLQEMELKQLELLVEQFLVFAELKTVERRAMYMRDWIRKLDEFIVFNERKVLTHSGKVSSEAMRRKVKAELEKYNQHITGKQQPLNLLTGDDETPETD